MKNKTYLIGGVCVVTIALSAASGASHAQDAEFTFVFPATASPAASPASKVRPIPFHGMILSVDRSAKTFTIAGKRRPALSS
jgi:hypothetical protein